MLFKRRKTPCYVLVFDQVEIIKKTLDFLTKYADQLDIIVVENPSANSPEIKQYLDGIGRAGLISQHYLFAENITSNAYTAAIMPELESVRKSKYVIITDGDVVVHNGDWLAEELSILKNHSDVFACGTTLNTSNLPLETFPDANTWIPEDTKEYPDFYEARTGGHLLLMRGAEFAAFMDWRQKNDSPFTDSSMQWFAFNELHKKWARTKHAIAYHLTWDLYHDKNHPYTKLKTSVSFKDTWNHNRTATYTRTDYKK